MQLLFCASVIDDVLRQAMRTLDLGQRDRCLGIYRLDRSSVLSIT